MLLKSMKWFMLLICLPSITWSFKLQNLDIFKKEEGKKCRSYEETCPVLDSTKSVHVHIVPHSHDDMGWLKNIDEYYYGMKSTIQRAGVQYILDSVIKELHWDPEKKFIQVETGFFWKWWRNQNTYIQDIVKDLVDEGRLEFIGGGWSMNDEATTHYSSIIDNMSFGFKTLLDTFGQCANPKVAWQIDPFGHSREQARLFAQMGMDSLFFARADFRDKDQRKESKTLNMMWKGSGKSDGPIDDDLFTGMFSGHYSNPSGFCFDIACTDEPINDNPKLQGYNVEEKAQSFYDMIMHTSSYYEGPSAKHIMLTFGDDFQYQNAAQNFVNIDKLIKYCNAHFEDIKVVYSTPSCYTYAINEEAKNEPEYNWPTKEDDFFPYAEKLHSYWTGYFTSRPSLKLYERETNNLLQSTKQINVLLGNSNEMILDECLSNKVKPRTTKENINVLKRAMGAMQHHDAVTGTEKEVVAHDYALRISDGRKRVEPFLGKTLFGRLGVEIDPDVDEFLCPLRNVSDCSLTTQNDKTILLVYNPLARPIAKYIRFPVAKDTTDVKIYNAEGEEVNVNLLEIHQTVKSIPGRKDEADFDAIFYAADLPPLGYRAYYVDQIKGFKHENVHQVSKILDTNIENDSHNVVKQKLGTFCAEGFPNNFEVNMEYYISSEESDQPSGAYVFRPRGENADDKRTFSISNVSFIESDLIMEAWYELQDNDNKDIWASYVARCYEGEPYIEIEWLVGPIPGLDGKEVVVTYKVLPSDNQSEDKQDDLVEFFTDANGRQNIYRAKNKRFSYDFTDKDIEADPITSNYYPITTGVYSNLYDNEVNNLQMSVLTDRSQGTTSLKRNELEIMVHRKTLKDDHKGVSEPLNEHAFGYGLVARGKHQVSFLNASREAPMWRRSQAQKLYMQPTELFLATEMTLAAWNSIDGQKKVFSGTNGNALPNNVHILSLEEWTMPESENDQVLLRLEHIFEENETNDELSQPVTFTLPDDFFATLVITNFREMSLGGNVFKEDMSRLKWTKNEDISNEGKNNDDIGERQVDGKLTIDITLKPMEIRTFLLDVEYL